MLSRLCLLLTSPLADARRAHTTTPPSRGHGSSFSPTLIDSHLPLSKPRAPESVKNVIDDLYEDPSNSPGKAAPFLLKPIKYLLWRGYWMDGTCPFSWSLFLSYEVAHGLVAGRPVSGLRALSQILTSLGKIGLCLVMWTSHLAKRGCVLLCGLAVVICIPTGWVPQTLMYFEC